MAYKLIPAAEVRQAADGFTFDLRRAWDTRMNLLVEDPLPREGKDFSIVAVSNGFGDRFLSLIADDFPFVVYFDVYPWPADEENPLGFDGIVNAFSLREM